MEVFLYIILACAGGLVLGLVVFAVTRSTVRTTGRSLAKKFAGLGNLRGKSYGEIAAICGKATAVISTVNGRLYQWVAPGYQVILLFDVNDICQGVSSESTY